MRNATLLRPLLRENGYFLEKLDPEEPVQAKKLGGNNLHIDNQCTAKSPPDFATDVIGKHPALLRLLSEQSHYLTDIVEQNIVQHCFSNHSSNYVDNDLGSPRSSPQSFHPTL